MQTRIAQETPAVDRNELWLTVALLMGLTYGRDRIYELLKGVEGMEESVIYQDILEKGEARGEVRGKAIGREEGRVEEALTLLLRIGSKRLGTPDASVKARLEAITSVDDLEQLADRLLGAETWLELLQ